VGEISEVGYRWTDENARQLYEAYEAELREMRRKRAVDLGISLDDGDDQTATALLRQNRTLRLSQAYRDEVREAWQAVIDPLVKRMVDLHGTYAVPYIIIKTDDN